MLEEKLNKIRDNEILPKRMVLLAQSEEHLRKRWQKEYLYGFKERKCNKNGSDTKNRDLSGKVVLLKEDIKNRAH
eukprot:gene1020-341_t